MKFNILFLPLFILCAISLNSNILARSCRYQSFGMVKMGYEKDIKKNELGIYLVKYLSKQEKKSFRFVFDKNGYFFKQSSEQVLDLEESMFVMDCYGRFFVGKKIPMKFHHSSFLAGRPVASAGYLTIKGGELVNLIPYSGHYMTSPFMFKQALNELRRHSVITARALPSMWNPVNLLNHISRSLARRGMVRFDLSREDFENKFFPKDQYDYQLKSNNKL